MRLNAVVIVSHVFMRMADPVICTFKMQTWLLLSSLGLNVALLYQAYLHSTSNDHASPCILTGLDKVRMDLHSPSEHLQLGEEALNTAATFSPTKGEGRKLLHKLVFIC